jgi:3-deoxy-D-manno-octulosonic-acid transferase
MSQPYSPSPLQELCRLLYSLLVLLLLPILMINLLLRLIFAARGYEIGNIQRFGCLPKTLHTGGMLIHCVSVGEVVAASAIVKALIDKYPKLPITITTTTVTGAKQASQLFADRVQHLYLPYDLSIFMNHLLARVKPQKVLITEVELWPNMLHCCWRKQIPAYVINARMTAKSARSYAKIPALFSPMLEKITHVGAQGKRDYDNYLSLGISPDKLSLTNNIKFSQSYGDAEIALAEQLHKDLQLSGRILIVAGSTHDTEEQALIDAYLQLQSTYPELLLVLVPRHPQRFDKVWQLCMQNKLLCLRVSEQQRCEPQTQVVLVDKMGMLRAFYALSNIAFVGGSLADKGGHNALEPATYAVPVLMGPHTYNNPQICQVLEATGALKIVADKDEIIRQSERWLEDPAQAKLAGEAGLQVLKENAGALEATLRMLSL